MPSKEKLIKHSTILSAYLLVVWGFYRFIFKLPEEIEELIIKPVLWLVPVFILMVKEKQNISSLGFTTKNLFSSIYLSLGLGALFAIEGVVVNVIKYDTIQFNADIGQTTILFAFLISIITAISEEVTFRGYLFNRVSYALKSDFWANLLTSTVWGLIHLPVSIFWLELKPAGVLGFFMLTTLFGIGSAFIFSRTKNITSSILLHIMWGWPIVLFR